jgi:hypothetical protein
VPIGLDTRIPKAVDIAGVLGGKSIVAISAGSSHSLALCSDGSIAAWGSNWSGQLGNNSLNHSWEPVLVDASGSLAGKTVIAISAGYDHNLARCSDGTIVGWGANYSSQLGDTSTTFEPHVTPIAMSNYGILAGKTIASLSAATSYNLVRCTDGTVATWGRFYVSAPGPGSPQAKTTAIPASIYPGSALLGEQYTAVFNSPGGSTNLGLLAAPVAPAVAQRDPSYPAVGFTLQGAIHCGGSPTTAQFEYGMTTDYGQAASVTLVPNDGRSPQAVSATLTDLPYNTKYHYRLTAVNMAGATSTLDGTFATPLDPASAHTFQSADDTWITDTSFRSLEVAFTPSLAFAPPAGTNLTVIHNLGTEPLHGRFTNLLTGKL